MPTLTELIKDYNPLELLLGYIDKALQILISVLRYEPDQIDVVIPVYEHISLLKQAIANKYIPNQQ